VPNEHAENTGTRKRRPPEEPPALDSLENGSDRLVAFDAETTGKRTPDAEFIRKQPFAWRAPGIIIEVGFVEMLGEGDGWRKGEAWSSRVNPDGPIDPEAIKIHKIRAADLKNAPRFPTILSKVKDFVAQSRSWPTPTRTSEISLTMSSPGPR
jgi:DNA polymerase III epsilon subunit-like protein